MVEEGAADKMDVVLDEDILARLSSAAQM